MRKQLCVAGLVTAFFVVIPTVQAARPIDLENRVVALEVTQDNLLSTTLESRTVPSGSNLQALTHLSEADAQNYFGLRIPTTGETTVTLNGEWLGNVPEVRSESVVYQIHPTQLKSGEVTVEIEREDAGPWAGTLLFSLRDSFEEAHFPEAFGEPRASAQPGIGVRETPPSATQLDYDVLWYDMTLKPDVNSRNLLPGTMMTIGARAVSSLSAMDLDFDLGGYAGYGGSLQISSVDSGPGTPALTYTNLANVNAPRIRVALPRTYAAGEEFRVRIAYHGEPNPQFPKNIYGNRASWNRKSASGTVALYSENQPYGARRWFPCKDHPSDKATTMVQRLIVPTVSSGNPWVAVGNGKLVSTVTGPSTTEYIWEHNYPIATYLVSASIAKYAYRGGTYTALDGVTQMPVGSYLFQNRVSSEGTGWQGTLYAMNFFTDIFGEYPFLDEKYVTVTWHDNFGIEHQTCTSIPAGELAIEGGLSRRNVHELAHQWFGNQIAAANFDHVWLAEGFANYAEALFDEYHKGHEAFRSKVRGWSIGNGPVVTSDGDLYQAANVYNRAARVLDMLRLYLGDAKFFQVLKDYAAVGHTTALSQPGDGPAGVYFQTIVEQSAGMTTGSMDQFFRQWLYSSQADTEYAPNPVYSYSATYDVETSSVQVRLKQVQGRQPFAMPVPIRLIAADSSTTTVLVPPLTNQKTFALGDFRPVSFQFDPDDWLIRGNGVRILNIDLPQAVAGQGYTGTLNGLINSGTASWQKLAGTPSWLSVASNGTLSGTPPAAGVYPVRVRLSSTNGDSIDAHYKLVVGSGSPTEPTPPVVINEVAYEAPSSATTTEFVELKNNDSNPVNMSGWVLALVDQTGSAYSTVTIPNGTTLAPGGYYVIANSSLNLTYPGVVDLATGWTNSLKDTAPGGIVLRTQTGARVDSLAYRADVPFSFGPYFSDLAIAGGTGRVLSREASDPAKNATLGRLPDGVDTGNNLQDFAAIPPSPGSANGANLTLPFFDDFNSGPKSPWRAAFQALRTATPTAAGKPSKTPPAPAGGAVLEVFDSTGGGDVAYLPGAFDQMNFEGYIWIPQTVSTRAWSTGLGIAVRAESSWFGPTAGFAIPNGFYLEYQNGPDVALSGSLIPNGPGKARLLACDSSAVPGTGLSAMDVTILGETDALIPEEWAPFRLVFDRPGNRLIAEIGGIQLYDGPIPPGGYNTSGGVCVGFRENHPGNPSPANNEGTWVDNIRLDTNVAGSAVEDYELY